MASKAKKSDKEMGTDEQSERTVNPASRRPLVLVAVILVSIIMVGSILLPSLSAIVSGMKASSSSADGSDVASSDSAAATTSSYMDQLDSRYSATASSLESKLEANPDDAASLINLANTYLTWGDMARNYASTDDERAHVTDLLQKAEGYYDTYLASNDAKAAHVNRALCQYYLGDTDGAIAALEQFCAGTADYAPAWANLGMIYEDAGETDKATDAYNKALEVDPDDTCGMKSFVTSKLQSITSSDAATDTTADAE